jgi:hypothetical protein
MIYLNLLYSTRMLAYSILKTLLKSLNSNSNFIIKAAPSLHNTFTKSRVRISKTYIIKTYKDLSTLLMNYLRLIILKSVFLYR